MPFTPNCSKQIERCKAALKQADAVVVGAGAGLSAAAGLTYGGERFMRYFADFHAAYGIADMYSGGFYPYETSEEYWAWWSRHIYCKRYIDPPKPVYDALQTILQNKAYFVITTNVDHCFQRAGFDKKRLFYTQGDYGLFQCSVPCRNKTYDNEQQIRRMVKLQKDMRIPSELIPHCPVCGKPLTVNLRSDDTFVQDDGWQAAYERYEAFLRAHEKGRVLYLELGVGGNTPAIIKYPFWRYTLQNPQAVYACINRGESFCPPQIADRSICIDADIGEVLERW